jgi:DNA-binding transcriptional ArsR family regulator
LADRVVAVIFNPAIGLRVRNSTYRAAIGDLEEINDATASRDLGKLVEANLLEAYGEKRGRYYSRSHVSRLCGRPSSNQGLRRTIATRSRMPL